MRVATAHISADGLYRDALTRTWADEGMYLTFIMLNPSTADANIDDPTIRRCVGFAKRDGYCGINVLNLYSYRATNPKELRSVADPVGPSNIAMLHLMFIAAKVDSMPIVAAWGATPLVGLDVRMDVWVRRQAHDLHFPLLCLGTTANGSPRHPLYVKGDQPLVPYR